MAVTFSPRIDNEVRQMLGLSSDVHVGSALEAMIASGTPLPPGVAKLVGRGSANRGTENVSYMPEDANPYRNYKQNQRELMSQSQGYSGLAGIEGSASNARKANEAIDQGKFTPFMLNPDGNKAMYRAAVPNVRVEPLGELQANVSGLQQFLKGKSKRTIRDELPSLFYGYNPQQPVPSLYELAQKGLIASDSLTPSLSIDSDFAERPELRQAIDSLRIYETLNQKAQTTGLPPDQLQLLQEAEAYLKGVGATRYDSKTKAATGIGAIPVNTTTGLKTALSNEAANAAALKEAGANANLARIAEQAPYNPALGSPSQMTEAQGENLMAFVNANDTTRPFNEKEAAFVATTGYDLDDYFQRDPNAALSISSSQLNDDINQQVQIQLARQRYPGENLAGDNAAFGFGARGDNVNDPLALRKQANYWDIDKKDYEIGRLTGSIKYFEGLREQEELKRRPDYAKVQDLTSLIVERQNQLNDWITKPEADQISQHVVDNATVRAFTGTDGQQVLFEAALGQQADPVVLAANLAKNQGNVIPFNNAPPSTPSAYTFDKSSPFSGNHNRTLAPKIDPTFTSNDEAAHAFALALAQQDGVQDTSYLKSVVPYTFATDVGEVVQRGLNAEKGINQWLNSVDTSNPALADEVAKKQQALADIAAIREGYVAPAVAAQSDAFPLSSPVSQAETKALLREAGSYSNLKATAESLAKTTGWSPEYIKEALPRLQQADTQELTKQDVLLTNSPVVLPWTTDEVIINPDQPDVMSVKLAPTAKPQVIYDVDAGREDFAGIPEATSGLQKLNQYERQSNELAATISTLQQRGDNLSNNELRELSFLVNRKNAIDENIGVLAEQLQGRSLMQGLERGEANLTNANRALAVAQELRSDSGDVIPQPRIQAEATVPGKALVIADAYLSNPATQRPTNKMVPEVQDAIAYRQAEQQAEEEWKALLKSDMSSVNPAIKEYDGIIDGLMTQLDNEPDINHPRYQSTNARLQRAIGERDAILNQEHNNFVTSRRGRILTPVNNPTENDVIFVTPKPIAAEQQASQALTASLLDNPDAVTYNKPVALSPTQLPPVVNPQGISVGTRASLQQVIDNINIEKANAVRQYVDAKQGTKAGAKPALVDYGNQVAQEGQAAYERNKLRDFGRANEIYVGTTSPSMPNAPVPDVSTQTGSSIPSSTPSGIPKAGFSQFFGNVPRYALPVAALGGSLLAGAALGNYQRQQEEEKLRRRQGVSLNF